MWVSTGNSGILHEKFSTTAALFGPTPLKFVRYSFARSGFILQRNDKFSFPSCWFISVRICLIRLAFTFAKPHCLIASLISASEACMHFSHFGNLFFSSWNAGNDCASVVLCDSSTAISASSGSSCAIQFSG